MTAENWLDRKGKKLPVTFKESDYPDHHMATLRCRSCGQTWDAVYPKDMNVLRVFCRECGAQDSEVAKYTKYIYKQ